MTRFPLVMAGLVVASMTGAAAHAADTDDMINQLLPAGSAKPATPAATVLDVTSATKDEMVRRLGEATLTRSLNPAAARPLALGAGHEAEALGVLQKLPSLQVAVAFQGASDALAPEADALLASLSQALSDDKLRPYRFVVGVHTNSVGSDEYNLSLSALRAKAIVDALVSQHALPRERLYAMGFGRLVDSSVDSGAPSERIRIVNLGDTPVSAPGATPAPALVTRAPDASPVVIAHKRPIMPLAAVRPKLASHPLRRTFVSASRPYPMGAHRSRVSATQEGELAPNWGYYDQTVTRRHPEGVETRLRRKRRFSSPDAEPVAVGGAYASDAAGWSGYGHGGGSAGGGSASSGHASAGGGGSGGGSGSGGSGGSGSGGSGGGPGGGGSGGSGSGGSGGSAGGSGSGGSGGGSGGSGGSGGGSGGSGGSGGGSGGGGGHSWSDRRLKRNVALIGRSRRGFNIYSFDYIWGGPRIVGVMAQEVLVQCPAAVVSGPGGYLQVDYSKLDVVMMTLEDWRSIQPTFQPVARRAVEGHEFL